MAFCRGAIRAVPELIAELLALKVDIIITSSAPAYHALQRAGDPIPLVLLYLTDPVGGGFVRVSNTLAAI